MFKRISFYLIFIVVTLAMSVSLFAAELVLNITGMTWPSSWPVSVRRVLEELDGVKKARVSFQLKEAIVEFNKVQYLLEEQNNRSLESIELLAQAQFNLGITYAKMNFYNQAEQEILNALSLIPNPEYREVLALVRKKMETK